jgi:sugar lactone lactonase YvrE
VRHAEGGGCDGQGVAELLGGERGPVGGDPGVPDGLTLDADGCLWLAVFGAGEVRRYTPAGDLDSVIRLPVD